MSIFSRVIVPALTAALCYAAPLYLAAPLYFAAPMVARAQSATADADQPSEATWNSIKGDIFKDRPILDGTGLVILDAPRRAEDAAIVPIGMRVNLPGDDKRTLQSLTLVIDENPAPVAGTFTIGPHSGVTSISTRVRVNSYSYVRAVAELSDGKLYGVKAFVKASGGCSAPASSNADATKSMLGQMKFRTFRPEAERAARGSDHAAPSAEFRPADGSADAALRAAVLHRYPKIWQGDDLVVAMEGGIAISEDPNIRFNYKPNGAANFRVEAGRYQQAYVQGRMADRQIDAVAASA